MLRNRTMWRTVNVLVWIAIWAAVVDFTESWGDWVSMFFQAIIPIMIGLYLHIVLRPHPERD
jgi:hypothetical protein